MSYDLHTMIANLVLLVRIRLMVLCAIVLLLWFAILLAYAREVIVSAFAIAAIAGLLAFAPDIYRFIVEEPEAVAWIIGGLFLEAGVFYLAIDPVRPRRPADQTFAFKLGRRLGQLMRGA